jgi:hypothetical protein
MVVLPESRLSDLFQGSPVSMVRLWKTRLTAFKSTKLSVSGQSGAEEMCNLYLMYYTLSDRDDFKICFDEEDRALSWRLPEGKSSRV